MTQVPIKLGPLALLLTVISICLTTLAILTFTTAQADQRLADRYAQTVETRYQLETQGQAFYQEVQEAVTRKDTVSLVPYLVREPNEYEKQITEGDASLTVRIRNEDGDCKIVSWKTVHSWEEDTNVNIWNGSGW